MTTMDMAKKAFASRRAVNAWFKDAAPNFEAFAEMVRKDEREACAETAEAAMSDANKYDIADAIRMRSNA